MGKNILGIKPLWVLAFFLAFGLHAMILYIFLLTPVLHEVKDKGAFVLKNRSDEIRSIMVVQSIYPGELQQTQIDQIKSIPKKKIEKVKKKPEKIKEKINTFKVKTPIQVKEKKKNVKNKTKEKKVVHKVQKQNKIHNKTEKKLSNINSKKLTASKPISKNNNVITSTSTGYSDAKKTSWKSLVMAHLSRYKDYPLDSLEKKQEGVSYIQVFIDEAGNILEAKVKKTSGYFQLDKASLLLINKASPLPRPPNQFFASKESIKFTLPIRYDIKEFLRTRL